jgi:hypothetical protein
MPAALCVTLSANWGYVLRLEAFLALGHREFNTLSLFQIAEAIATDSAEVHEHIFAAIAGDESEALSAIEPFNGSLFSVSHGDLELLSSNFGSRVPTRQAIPSRRSLEQN